MAEKRALITGITGQDGSYLAELLLSLGYEVHGAIRSTTADISESRIKHLVGPMEPQVTLHITDMTDSNSLIRLISKVQPSELYNLAAQSHVAASFDQPVHTANVSGIGVVRILDAVRLTDPSIRFYQACSSEMFGSTAPPQNEQAPFHPRSPYGVAKVYAYWSTVNYREAFGIHASNGILFNHESPRRGRHFVTRKIASAIPLIVKGEKTRLRLGNLEARRDWGHARDYVLAMYQMVQHPTPLDLVIGTGTSRSVREFVANAFDLVGLDWSDYVDVDENLLRPAEVDHLQADASQAREIIGWEPLISFESLVREMVEAEMNAHGLSL